MPLSPDPYVNAMTGILKGDDAALAVACSGLAKLCSDGLTDPIEPLMAVVKTMIIKGLLKEEHNPYRLFEYGLRYFKPQIRVVAHALAKQHTRNMLTGEQNPERIAGILQDYTLLGMALPKNSDEQQFYYQEWGSLLKRYVDHNGRPHAKIMRDFLCRYTVPASLFEPQDAASGVIPGQWQRNVPALYQVAVDILPDIYEKADPAAPTRTAAKIFVREIGNTVLGIREP